LEVLEGLSEASDHKDAVALGVVSMEPCGEGDLEVRISVLVMAHPLRDSVRRAERAYRKQKLMSVEDLAQSATMELPALIRSATDDPRARKLCLALLIGLLAGSSPLRAQLAEVRADPERWPLLVLTPVPLPEPSATMMAVYGMPRAVVPEAPSFQDLMETLEQAGTGDG
jgi:hypothetical protein